VNVVGRIESNNQGPRPRSYVLIMASTPAYIPPVLLSAVTEDGRPREGWCEVTMADGAIVFVNAIAGWYPVNGDILIAAKLVPAPPPMIAVPS
jgi:hypothetical protein